MFVESEKRSVFKLDLSIDKSNGVKILIDVDSNGKDAIFLLKKVFREEPGVLNAMKYAVIEYEKETSLLSKRKSLLNFFRLFKK